MKEGFIYIWYDSWRKMYYIGCHWGTEDDGYICSSWRMRKAYRRRTQDFKRKVIQRGISRETLLDEEHKWLRLIPDEQLGKKYYNHSKKHFGHWSTDLEKRNVVGRQISASPNRGKKISEALLEHYKNTPNKLKGVKRSPETIQKMIANHTRSMMGRKYSEEHKRKISEAHKGKPKTKEHGQNISRGKTGFKYTEESKKKMSEDHKGTKKPWVKGQRGPRSEETKRKMSIASFAREEKKRIARNAL